MPTFRVEADPTSSLYERAELFRSMHSGGAVLVLANAWDAGSACVAAAAGAAAVATTSAGVAWSLGVADGEHLDRDSALDVLARVAAAVDVPVTADMEGGYAGTPDGVAETVCGVLAAGAVGVNLEDIDHADPPGLRPLDDQIERVAAARSAADAAGIPLFLNARIDTYLYGVGDPATRLDNTLARAAAYVAAGADGIFVPGVTEPAVVAELAAGVDAPLNVMAGPGAPTVAELAALGVTRVSVGPAITLAAYAVVRDATRELVSAGDYTALSDGLDFGDLNASMRGRRFARNAPFDK